MKTKLSILKWSISLLFFILFQSIYANGTKDSIPIYLNNFQYAKALSLIQKCLANDPDNNQLYYWEGDANKGFYRFTEAILAYKKALLRDSTNIRNIIEIANTYKLIPDYENALRYYILASHYDSCNISFRFEIANCKFSLDRYPLALNDYRLLYAGDTSNLFLIKRMAICYFRVGELDSSINFYRSALCINSLDAGSVSNICNLLLLKKAYADCIGITEAYQKLDSTNSKINSLNAYFYLLNNNYRISIHKFNRCLEMEDTSKFTIKNIGIAYFREESYDTAKFYLEKAYFMDTADISNVHFLGIACSKSFYKELGVFYLEKAVHLYEPTIEKYASLYLNLSQACKVWGNCTKDKKAKVNLKAIYFNPQELELIYDIASYYDFDKMDKSKAIEYYTLLLGKKPDKEVIAKNDVKYKLWIYESAKKRLEKLQQK